jgi:hypothetical protein
MDKGLPAAAAAMGVTAQGGVDPGDVVLTRMAQDERDVQVRGVWFAKALQQQQQQQQLWMWQHRAVLTQGTCC